MDDLRLSDLLPHVSRLFEKNHEGVGIGHSVHIGQAIALEADRKLVGEAAAAEIGSSEDCRV